MRDVEIIRVGDICDLKNGFAFKSKDYVESSDTMNFRMSQIRPGGKVDLDHNPKYLPNDYTDTYSDYLLNEGDMVIAMTDMASDTKILGVPTIVKSDDKKRKLLLNQRVGKLTDLKKELIHVPYLRFIVTSPQIYAYYKKLGKGGMQINLGKNDILNALFPLISLPEQRAIVAKIEELFSDLDKGIADLKKAQDQLKVYRQAVLKKAFEGLNEVPFDQLVTSSQNGMAKRRGSEGKETKVLRLADITNLEIDNSSPRSIMLTQKEHEKYQLHEGDLLAIRVNGSIDLVGRFIHVTKKDESENWAFCDHLIRVTLDEERAVSKFYFYFFQLPEVRKFIHENMVSSAGQNTVSQGTLKGISVPTTALEEQNQIVQEIESRLSVCDKVKESITESLEKAKALRQSILKKAFEGTLLSEEEIASCKAAPDYEPASVLLERIKAEKKKK